MIQTEITAAGAPSDGTIRVPSPPVVNLIPATPEKPSLFVAGSSLSPMHCVSRNPSPVDPLNIDTGGEDTGNLPPTAVPASIPQAEEDPVKFVIATSSLALPSPFPARPKSKSKSRSPSPNVHLDVPILERQPLRRSPRSRSGTPKP